MNDFLRETIEKQQVLSQEFVKTARKFLRIKEAISNRQDEYKEFDDEAEKIQFLA